MSRRPPCAQRHRLVPAHRLDVARRAGALRAIRRRSTIGLTVRGAGRHGACPSPSGRRLHCEAISTPPGNERGLGPRRWSFRSTLMTGSLPTWNRIGSPVRFVITPGRSPTRRRFSSTVWHPRSTSSPPQRQHGRDRDTPIPRNAASCARSRRSRTGCGTSSCRSQRPASGTCSGTPAASAVLSRRHHPASGCRARSLRPQSREAASPRKNAAPRRSKPGRGGRTASVAPASLSEGSNGGALQRPTVPLEPGHNPPSERQGRDLRLRDARLGAKRLIPPTHDACPGRSSLNLGSIKRVMNAGTRRSTLLMPPTVARCSTSATGGERVLGGRRPVHASVPLGGPSAAPRPIPRR